MVGDFDGDGRPDIAWNDGSNWYYSSAGRGPRTLLRSGASLVPYASLPSLLFGRFDGGRRTEAVAFERQVISTPGSATVVNGSRLAIWRGAGSGSAFSELSPQDMR